MHALVHNIFETSGKNTGGPGVLRWCRFTSCALKCPEVRNCHAPAGALYGSDAEARMLQFSVPLSVHTAPWCTVTSDGSRRRQSQGTSHGTAEQERTEDSGSCLRRGMSSWLPLTYEVPATASPPAIRAGRLGSKKPLPSSVATKPPRTTGSHCGSAEAALLGGRSSGVRVPSTWLTATRGSPGFVPGGREVRNPCLRRVLAASGHVTNVTLSPSCTPPNTLHLRKLSPVCIGTFCPGLHLIQRCANPARLSHRSVPVGMRLFPGNMEYKFQNGQSR